MRAAPVRERDLLTKAELDEVDESGAEAAEGRYWKRLVAQLEEEERRRGKEHSLRQS
jgi:hypothetical protein